MKSVFAPGAFKGETVLVTGGGSGIGRAVVLEAAGLGAELVVIGRDESKLSSVSSEVESMGGRCHRFVCDLQDEAQIENLLTQMQEQGLQPTALVNNAGGQFIAPADQISNNGFKSVMQLNFFAGADLARRFFSGFFKERGGRIVNVIADMFDGMPMMAHSGAARAAMENFTKTAAIEWGRCGVTVNAVAPGYIESSGLESYPPEAKALLDQLSEHVPLQRLGTPEEVSSAICFLLGPGGSYMNGATLRVDGGSSLMFGPWKDVL